MAKRYTKNYIDGWEDLPLETTPITAAALNNNDDTMDEIDTATQFQTSQELVPGEKETIFEGKVIADSFQKHIISAWPASSAALTATNTLQTVDLANTSIIGSKLTFNSTNKSIVVGAGVSRVMVSASIAYVLANGNNTRNLYIRTTSGITKKFTFSYATTTWNGRYWSVLSTPIMINVNPGDQLILVAYGYIGDTIEGSTATNLLVEVVE